MTHAPNAAIILLWIVFILVWVVKAQSAKAMAVEPSLGQRLAHRVPMTGGAVLIFLDSRRTFPRGVLGPLWSPGPVSQWLCVGVVFIGLLIALQARFALGRNWSGRVMVKQDHELVTAGAYAWVRHPIYTGLLLMIGGSALAYATPGALVGFLIFTTGVVIKLRQEEALMMRQFPDSYPDYRQRVKRLIPFVW